MPLAFFPAIGVNGDTNPSIASLANQPGGVWPVNDGYNFWNGSGAYNATGGGAWGPWAGFGGGGQSQLICLQVSPFPRGTGGNGLDSNGQPFFNINDLLTNHQSDYDQLAKNCQTAGNVLSVQIGWEWNSGGANDFGWDATGNEANYIRVWRKMATSFMNYAPTVIRCWAMNTSLMHTGGSPSDFYPGDKYVDAIGVEPYEAFNGSGGGPGGISASLGNSLGYCDAMSAATFLGANNPGTVDGEAVTFGAAKYMVFAEGQQQTAADPNYITNLFAWMTNSARNWRTLTFIYWNDYSVVGDNNDLLSPGNGPANAFIAATNGNNYVARFPIPRLSGGSSPSISVTTPGTIAAGSSFTVSGTLANYTVIPTLQYEDDSGAFAALPSGASVTLTAFVFTNPGISVAGQHSLSVRDASSTSVLATSGSFTVFSGPSASNTIVTAVGTAIVDTSSNAWTITSAGKVAYNGTAIATTSGVTQIAYVNGVIWEFSGGKWFSFGALSGGVPTLSAGTTTSPLTPSATQTVAVLTGASIVDSQGYAFALDGTGKIDVNGAPISFTSSVTLICVVAGIIWQFAGGSWYSITDTAGTITPATGPLSTSPLTTPTASGTGITTIGGPAIIDTVGNAFTIGSNGQIYVNGVANSIASSVTELAYVNGVVYWQSGGQWTSLVDTTGTITKGTGPSATSPLTAPTGSLTIITPTQQNAGATFAVQGTVVNYTAAPTLNFRDDSGTYAALPVGNSVTTSSFSFTNPGLAAGSHTVSVRDANNTSIAVTTPTFTVVTPVVPVISVAAPSLPATGQAFTLNGTLGNYAAAPSLTFADDTGATSPLPSGAMVSATSFTFLHPGLAVGSHSTVISDGSASGSVSYTVTTIAGGASANLTVVTPGSGSITDSTSNRWSLTSSGQVVIDGVIDTTGGTGVIELAYVSSVVWKEASGGLWQYKSTPTAAWLPTGGTTTSPLTIKSITINSITSAQAGATFTVTGSLANYSPAPTLNYADDGNAATALPTGATVSTTAFSFTHPTLPSGSHTLTISDGQISTNLTYTVLTAGWISVSPTTTGLSATVSGLAVSTAYDLQVLATNSFGQGPASSLITMTTASAAAPTLANAPTGLASPSVSQTFVNLTWTAPTVGTAPFTYATQRSPTGANTWTAGPTVSTTSAQITGLSAGTVYDFEVAAINGAGQGPFSSAFTTSTASATASAVAWQPPGTGPLTYSNSNLTATAGGSATVGAAEQSCISTTSLSAGQVAFEVTFTTLTQNCFAGLCSSSHPLASVLGADAQSVGFSPVAGTRAAQSVYVNGAPVLSPSGNAPGSDANGATFTFCGDLNADLLWISGPAMRTAYGPAAWNDSATASPATASGGISLAGALSGALSIAFSTAESGGVAVLNTGSSAFSFSGVPSNYSGWNGSAVTVVIPAAVTSLTSGTITATTAVLSWTAPVTGSAPFTYAVQQSPHSAATYVQVASVLGVATATVTGLSPSTAYDFRVSAGNGAGVGGFSNVITVTTPAVLTVPGQVVGVSATAI